MDNLTICRINNMTMPSGLPVTFEGKKIGHVVSSNEEHTQIAINSDVVKSLLRSGACTYSLEVVRSEVRL